MVDGQWSILMVNENGGWWMVEGRWSMVGGGWSMVNGQWSMVNFMVDGQWPMWAIVHGQFCRLMVDG